jgi:hypothetical protein
MNLMQFYINATLHGLTAHQAALLGAMMEAYPGQPDWGAFRERAKIPRQTVHRLQQNLAARAILHHDDKAHTYTLNLDVSPPRPVSGLAGRLPGVIIRADASVNGHVDAVSAGAYSVSAIADGVSASADTDRQRRSASADAPVSAEAPALTRPSSHALTASASALTDPQQGNVRTHAGAGATERSGLIEGLNLSINQSSEGGSGGADADLPGEPLTQHDPAEVEVVIAGTAKRFGHAVAELGREWLGHFTSLAMLKEAILTAHAEARRTNKPIAHLWPWVDAKGNENPGYLLTLHDQYRQSGPPVRALPPPAPRNPLDDIPPEERIKPWHLQTPEERAKTRAESVARFERMVAMSPGLRAHRHLFLPPGE